MKSIPTADDSGDRTLEFGHTPPRVVSVRVLDLLILRKAITLIGSGPASEVAGEIGLCCDMVDQVVGGETL